MSAHCSSSRTHDSPRSRNHSLSLEGHVSHLGTNGTGPISAPRQLFSTYVVLLICLCLQRRPGTDTSMPTAPFGLLLHKYTLECAEPALELVFGLSLETVGFLLTDDLEAVLFVFPINLCGFDDCIDRYDKNRCVV